MNQFIVELLTQEHDLNDSEINKLLLNVKDFLKMLCCHWVMNINFFSHERQRVQIVTLLLLIAIIDSHLETLLRIIYDDIDMFILRDKKIDEIALTLQLRLKKIKSRQKRKQSWDRTLSLSLRDIDFNAEKSISSLWMIIQSSAWSFISWLLLAMTKSFNFSISLFEWYSRSKYALSWTVIQFSDMMK